MTDQQFKDDCDPLIIFKIVPTTANKDTFAEAAGIPVVADIVKFAKGIPIPIYLNEKLSGIIVDSIGNSTDIDTTVEGFNKATALDVQQRVIDSTITINMTCNNKDSLVLSAILAFMDIILRKAVARAYTISFVNGSTIVLDGLLKSFTTNQTADSELTTMSLVINKVNNKPDPVLPTVDPIKGAAPISNIPT